MKIYTTILGALVGLDAIWLGVIMKPFYRKYLGYLMGEKFMILPAVAFYILYAFGIMYFVVKPALIEKSLTMAITRGTILGLLAYATYDLTNHATIAKWPGIVTVVDILWGVVVTALVSAIAYAFLSK